MPSQVAVSSIHRPTFSVSPIELTGGTGVSTWRIGRALLRARASIASPSRECGHARSMIRFIDLLPLHALGQASTIDSYAPPLVSRPCSLTHCIVGLQQRTVVRSIPLGKNERCIIL